MKTRLLLLSAGVIGCFSLTVAAADWPQWRGPQRNGISQETGLLKEWPKDGPKQVWQVTDLDYGFSTPAVVGDRIYLLSNKGTDDEFVQARAVKDGNQVWSRRLGKSASNTKGGPDYPGARSTPTVDGDVLYALGSDGDLACVETAKGEVRWRKNLRDDFGGKPGNWAYAESPLIDGDVLVCTPGGEKATMVGLNKKTGDVVWTCPVPGGDEAAYASAIVMEVGGVRMVVQFLQHGLVGVEAKTGKFLWRYAQTAEGSRANIPSPVAFHEYVYSAAGQSGSGLVKLKAENSGVTAAQVYFDKKLPTSIGGVVEVGGALYGTNSRGLICADFLTGDIKWQDKSIGAGSVCYADGCLYLHGENGEVTLVEATPTAYHEKGRFTPPGQPNRGKAKAWAYPVVANGRLYVRDLGVLWCYDVKDGSASK
jgi:outer membrane protein assembly factor BamB